MPNWMEGTLKIRGTSENIVRFFTEGLGQPSGKYENAQMSELVHDCSSAPYYEFAFENDPWVKDTHRAFLSGECEWEDDPDEPFTVLVDVRQAWKFKPDEWRDIAQKYNLNFRLYGFERGGQFCQEIEIRNGVITLYKIIRYEDWGWECPMPKMGG